MKLRNYFIYWANRLMDPKFKNQYYQANLQQFWDKTYSQILDLLLISFIISIVLTPFIAFFSTHPMYHKKFYFLITHFLINFSCNIIFAFMYNRANPSDKKVNDNFIFILVAGYLMAIFVQNFLMPANYFFYSKVYLAAIYHMLPIIGLWSIKTIMIIIPDSTTEKIDNFIEKVKCAMVFLFVNPENEEYRFTNMLANFLGKPVDVEKHKIKELDNPKPKDYKIWGVKSKQEREIQKILDE